MRYNLDDFIQSLCLGDLSNLYIGLQGQVELTPANRLKLINYMNQGLNALCSRFSLVQKEVIIRTSPEYSMYPLREEYGMTAGTDKRKFILDSPAAVFKGDVIKILKVFTEAGRQLPINDDNNNASVFTPVYDTLQITHPGDGIAYSVIYQGQHDLLADSAHGSKQFNIPPYLEEALVSFVAGKAYGHMGGAENMATAETKMTRFNEICAEVEQKDLTGSSEESSSTKLEDKGFI